MINYKAYSVILMDDECLICNRLVKQVAKRDSKDKFRVCGLKSELGKSILKAYALEGLTPDSIILIEGDKIYKSSEAVLKISDDLHFYKLSTNLLRILPLHLRDRLYFLIAKNRYSLFGKSKYCAIDPVLTKKIIY